MKSNGLMVAGLASLLAACTSVTTRSYSEPLPYVNLAAQEACATAGFAVTPRQTTATQLSVDRSLAVGFLIGDGGSHVTVDLTDTGGGTDVRIVSEKRFVGFLAQRHFNEEIASYLDGYLVENRPIKDKLDSSTQEKNDGD